MFERFARGTRVAVDDARYEAARRGDRRVGTEHLLITLLEDDELATTVGVDAEAARAAAAELDRSALAAIGVDLGDFAPQGRGRVGKLVPFTAGARQVMSRTLTHAAAEKARTLTARHMMLAVLERSAPDPAAALLEALEVDVPALRARLLPS
jgi:ATP-dependent Clp protease ATP-binding subunit ClpA